MLIINISFDSYFNDSIKCKIKFVKNKEIDNDASKEKLKIKLVKTENTRYQKEIEKKGKSAVLKEKHCALLEKINIKVKQLDGFVRSRQTRILPNAIQQKIVPIKK